LEKYKSMARDAQLAGDRVQTEYYLQYADHYFRVLGESRARFEDQRPRRDDLDEDEGEEEFVEASEDQAPAEDHQERGERPNRRNRPRRDDGDDRSAGEPDREQEPRRANGAGETIPFDALPPAIGRSGDDSTDASEEEPRRPRRRTSRAARPAEGEDEVAPAA
jgi:hypothetical protein